MDAEDAAALDGGVDVASGEPLGFEAGLDFVDAGDLEDEAADAAGTALTGRSRC